MRQTVRQFARVISTISLLLSGSALIIVFQNCGSSESANDPLTTSASTAVCLGVNCTVDITTAGFSSTVSGILIDRQSTTSNATTCDNTTCFDIGGYCELGGYTKSQFVYQWILGSGTTLPVVSTTYSCDSNGRYRVLIKIPYSQYNWGITNQVKVTMQVLDPSGNVLTNPNGTTSFTYTVTTNLN